MAGVPSGFNMLIGRALTGLGDLGVAIKRAVDTAALSGSSITIVALSSVLTGIAIGGTGALPLEAFVLCIAFRINLGGAPLDLAMLRSNAPLAPASCAWSAGPFGFGGGGSGGTSLCVA